MKNAVSSVVTITLFCLIGCFLGITVYVLIAHALHTGRLSVDVLYQSEYTIKLLATLFATLIGAVGQELIVPTQHKFTFWQFIKRNGMLRFALWAGIILVGIGLIVVFIKLFMIQGASFRDFFTYNYGHRFTSIIPAAFIFGICYGLGRWKSFELQFGHIH
jgi:hypothetical protein